MLVSIPSADGRASSALGLDPPLVLYFPRLCWRTLLRLFRVEEQCSAGCEESARKAFFSRESIILWYVVSLLASLISVTLRWTPEILARRPCASHRITLTAHSRNRCLTNHSVARKREGERYRVDGVHVGGKRRRLGGWGGELAAWKQAVREMVELEANTDTVRCEA